MIRARWASRPGCARAPPKRKAAEGAILPPGTTSASGRPRPSASRGARRRPRLLPLLLRRLTTTSVIGLGQLEQEMPLIVEDGPVAALPQQLWCVTPFEKRKVDAWTFLETALTPRLCPRVFSREFVDRRTRVNGVIVGCSLGSIRVVRNALTGWRRAEYLLMVSVGDRCRRSWRSHADFATHARRFANRGSFAAPRTRAAWTVAECERRWLPCVEDYPHIASRHAAYEAVLREVLFHAEGPDELLQLAGASSVELPARGSPEQSSGDEEELFFGVEVSSSDLESQSEEPTVVDRVKNLFLGSSGPPVADALPRQRSRTPFPSMSCLTDGCGVSMDRGRSTEGSTSQTPLQAALARNHRSKHLICCGRSHYGHRVRHA